VLGEPQNVALATNSKTVRLRDLSAGDDREELDGRGEPLTQQLEHVRFGDRLTVERAVEEGAECCLVPPLLLQPLVENAIKHGVQNVLEGGAVCLEVRREGDLLVLTVENPLSPEAPARPGEGVGLENVRRRLAASGAREARLSAGRLEDRYRVKLELPLAKGDGGAGA
jgi:LytS/YehU family sensor histidine kinase